jgi:hypothetical protein
MIENLIELSERGDIPWRWSAVADGAEGTGPVRLLHRADRCELSITWPEGTWHDCTFGLSEEQNERLLASIVADGCRRPGEQDTLRSCAERVAARVTTVREREAKQRAKLAGKRLLAG